MKAHVQLYVAAFSIIISSVTKLILISNDNVQTS